MSKTHPRHPITLQRVVYRLEGMETVPVQRNVEYRLSEAGALAMDIYHPFPSASGTKVPVVLLVTGYPDVGVSSPLGCTFKDEDLPSDVPLFIARSGQDELPGLNDALGHFVSAAVRWNLPMTFVNHPAAPHCFELNDDSELSRSIIGQMLAFMQSYLT